MPDNMEKTITAKFEADTSAFTAGAEEVAASSQAIEESTAGMGKSFDAMQVSVDANGKVIRTTFQATSQAAADQANALAAMRESEIKGFTETAAASEKSATQIVGGMTAVSGESEKTSKSMATMGDAVKSGGTEAAGGLAVMGSESEKATTSITEVGATSTKAASSSEQLAEATKNSGRAAEESRQSHEGYHGSLLNEIQNIIQIVQLIGQWIGAMEKENESIANTSAAMTTLSGDTEKAAQAFNDLDKSAAAHDFGIVAIGNAEKHLMMLGVSAEEASKEIQRVSDSIASVGGNAAQVEPVVVELQKIKTESKVTTQEMDQLVSQGLPAWKLLADQMGISVEQAQKRVAAGAVTGSQAFNAIMDQSAKYSGAADAQSQSLGAEWTRLGENVSKAFGPFLNQLAAAIEQINELFDGTSKLDDAFRALGDSISKAFSNFGSAGSMGGFGMSGHASGIIDSPVGHMAMVGEDGPEPMWIPQGASVFPSGTNPFSALSSSAPALSSMMGGGNSGSQSITVNLHLDSRVVAQQVIPHIAPMARQQFGRRM
jgi:tape measure domain-containing protein